MGNNYIEKNNQFYFFNLMTYYILILCMYVFICPGYKMFYEHLRF